MNTLPNPIHHEWQDSMANWAEHTALEAERKAELQADWGLAERNEGAWVEVASGTDSAWWVQVPEMAVYDSTQDDERKPPMTTSDAYVLLFGYIASVIVATFAFGVAADLLPIAWDYFRSLL